jgi:hypothetical protein
MTRAKRRLALLYDPTDDRDVMSLNPGIAAITDGSPASPFLTETSDRLTPRASGLRGSAHAERAIRNPATVAPREHRSALLATSATWRRRTVWRRRFGDERGR